MRVSVLFAMFMSVALSIVPESVHAGVSGLTRVAAGISNPIFVTHAPGDRSRLFIAERTGGIRILNLQTGLLEATPFLTMSGVSTDGEGGFLGLAFHPNYFNQGIPGFGKFYVNVTTNSTTQTRIREFQVSATNPNLANAGSLREILSFSQPQINHNGGWIGFSPNNGYLYIATGDGGGGDDTGSGHTAGTGNAQDITNNLLGKILRVDVNSDGFPTDAARNYSIPATNPFVGVTGDDEIWAYGLRNPFRDSFDSLTGDLWIGDVGQTAREEIDFQPASSAGGENYGWRLREGTVATPTGGVGGVCTGCVEPVFDYGHPTGNPVTDLYRGRVVTGGYVYRGPDPSLQGKYFFLDSQNTSGTGDDNYWMFDPANPFGSVTNINSLMVANVGTHLFPSSFGEDAVGNLYITYLSSGEVYRIATAHIHGDYDNDGDVDTSDYNIWRSTLGLVASTAPADASGNGVVDAADYVLWRKRLGASLGSGAGAVTEAVPEAATIIYIAPVLGLLALRPFVRRRRLATMV
jgi:glucose/arabinose dehydrogenase